MAVRMLFTRVLIAPVLLADTTGCRIHLQPGSIGILKAVLFDNHNFVPSFISCTLYRNELTNSEMKFNPLCLGFVNFWFYELLFYRCLHQHYNSWGKLLTNINNCYQQVNVLVTVNILSFYIDIYIYHW